MFTWKQHRPTRSKVCQSNSDSKGTNKTTPTPEKDHLKLGKSWVESLFCRFGFAHRMKTTGKVKIPVGAQKEADLKFLRQIVINVEKHQIPPSLTINFDQTLSKYVQVLSTTMDQMRESNVPIAGISDKRNITATFSITLDNKFLLMQLIYQGKTGQSLPIVKFRDGLSLSVNESHYSNENEALKVIEEIILHYIREEREKPGCLSQKALLIFDVFQG